MTALELQAYYHPGTICLAAEENERRLKFCMGCGKLYSCSDNSDCETCELIENRYHCMEKYRGPHEGECQNCKLKKEISASN